MTPNPKLGIFPFLVFTLVFNKNELTFSEHFGFSNLLLPYFSRYYIATIDCVADEGVGLEDFEDPEDFAEPGKQPFDHTMKPFYACHIAIVVVTPES